MSALQLFSMTGMPKVEGGKKTLNKQNTILDREEPLIRSPHSSTHTVYV